MNATPDLARNPDLSRSKETLVVEPAAAARQPSQGGVRCREIGADDIGAVLDLLCEGFTRLPRSHWAAALELMRTRAIPASMPRYGYTIESDGNLVGILLLIAAELRCDGKTTTRCNGLAWYVRHQFRAYAPVLLNRSLRLPADMHLNVFPASHTFPIIEALGFVRFTNGISLSVPAVTLRSGRIRILPAGRLAEARHPIPDEDRNLLIEHHRAGCIALWCETAKGGHPFVFRRRVVKSWLPCAQLIYCRDLEDLTHLAGPVGRYLLRSGMPVVLAAANGAMPGVPGVYMDGKYPMYYRGTTRPQVGDLAYTEAGLFGF